MSSREKVLWDLARLATLIGIGVAVATAAVLYLGGWWSWLSWARAVLASAILLTLLELFVLQRTLTVTHVHTAHTSWRRVDKMPGCSLAVLLALLIVELFACGAMFEWLLEFR